MADNSPTSPARAPLPQPDENLLKSAPPLAFKPTGSSLEMRALEQTLAILNNTNVTGAVLPPEEREAAKAVMHAAVRDTANAPPATTLSVPPAAAPAKVVLFPENENDAGPTRVFAEPAITSAPASASPTPSAALPPPVGSGRVVLTGRTGVGKDWLASSIPGAAVLNLDSPIWAMVRELFPDGPAAGLFSAVQTIKAWGSGTISEKYPISPARMLYITDARVRDGWENFGRPGFWAEYALVTAAHTGGQIIVTGVETLAELNQLLAAGFAQYHVVCSSASYASRPKRPGADDSLSTIFDQQVTKELSTNPRGRVLRCVWSDSAPPPSPRLMTAQLFAKEILSVVPSTLETKIETGE